MKIITHLRQCAFAALIMAFSATTGWAQAPDMPQPSAEELAAQAAYELKLQQIAAVSADRYTAIASIVAIWETSWGQHEGWEAEFTAALEAANDERLAEIQAAASYDAVRAILQGQDAPVQLDGVSGTETLGSITSDLVFTPVVPCRFFDTRSDSDTGSIGHTGGSTATIRSYFVHGTAAAMQAQGGSVACPAPNGDPVGIAANFTAAPLVSPSSGKGNIRAYPYLGGLPGVSLVNYEAGTNIANAAIVATCFACGFDISVATQFHASASIGDVMGYFYPVDTAEFEAKFVGTSASPGASNSVPTGCANTAGAVSIFTPGPGFVTVQTEVLVYHPHIVNFTNRAYIYIGAHASDCPTSDIAGGYYRGWSSPNVFSPSGAYWDTVTISRKFQVTTPGTRTYYINGDFGIGETAFYSYANSATFHPQP